MGRKWTPDELATGLEIAQNNLLSWDEVSKALCERGYSLRTERSVESALGQAGAPKRKRSYTKMPPTRLPFTAPMAPVMTAATDLTGTLGLVLAQVQQAAEQTARAQLVSAMRAALDAFEQAHATPTLPKVTS